MHAVLRSSSDTTTSTGAVVETSRGTLGFAADGLAS
jgi:hypothetical protein